MKFFPWPIPETNKSNRIKLLLYNLSIGYCFAFYFTSITSTNTASKWPGASVIRTWDVLFIRIIATAHNAG